MPLSEVRFDKPETTSVWPITAARKLDWLAVTVLVALGSAVRFAHLTSKPFWFDECFSVELARLRFGSFIRVIWWREANMTLYYALLRAWLQFGHSEFFIRSLSVLFAVATIPAIYWLARQLFDRQVALTAALLFTLNAYNVRYAQEARSYSLFVLLATLSCGYFLAWLRNAKRVNKICYLVCSILAVYAHFYALLLIAAQWITLRFVGPPAPGNSNSIPSAAQRWKGWKTIGFGVLPLLLFVLKTGAGPLRWVQRPGWRDVLAMWQQFAGASNWLLAVIFLLACCAAAARSKVLQRAQNWSGWRIQFLLVWLFFPIVVTVVLSLVRPVFLPRFLIFCQPALIILVAAGIERLKTLRLIVPALAITVVLAGQGLSFVYGHDFDDQRDASGEASNFILDHAQPGDGIVFQIAETRLPYEFFRSLRAGENTASPDFTKQVGPEILFPRFGLGLDYSDFKAKPIPEILRSELPNYSRVWLMLMYSQGGGAGHSTSMLTRMITQRFPEGQCRDFPKVEVCLYLKGQGTNVGPQVHP